MKLIHSLRQATSAKQAKIVLPESGDIRTLQAANFLADNAICEPVLLGNPQEINQLCKKQSMTLHSGVRVVNYLESELTEEFAISFFEKRKHKGLSAYEARNTFKNELFFAASMVAHGYVNGCVAGAANTTGDVLRAAIQVIGLKKDSKVVSSVFLMSLINDKVLTYGDCAVVPYPTSEQLASIAIDSADTHLKLTGEEPNVAFLSFSTKGSAVHERTTLVTDALAITKNLHPDLSVDGELQFDAAFVPEIGKRKAPGSKVAGNANVFVFPNLDAGNIAYKITERLAGAVATGPIIQGLAAPMNDLSRGCSWEDIVNTAAVTALQSEN